MRGKMWQDWEMRWTKTGELGTDVVRPGGETVQADPRG